LENKRAEQVLPGRRRKMAQTMCTHVNKYKNDKIKKERERNVLCSLPWLTSDHNFLIYIFAYLGL
jgi:hypothetical protein